jgi:hypothetical protein
MTLELLRVGSDYALTQGVLRHNGRAFAVTLELPWRANEPEHSCIPPGTYECRRVQSPRFGNTFEVMDVPGRTHILFHKGNQTADTAGCLLVAEKFVDDRVEDSKEGYNELMRLFEGVDTFTLVIKEVP